MGVTGRAAQALDGFALVLLRLCSRSHLIAEGKCEGATWPGAFSELTAQAAGAVTRRRELSQAHICAHPSPDCWDKPSLTTSSPTECSWGVPSEPTNYMEKAGAQAESSDVPLTLPTAGDPEGNTSLEGEAVPAPAQPLGTSSDCPPSVVAQGTTPAHFLRALQGPGPLAYTCISLCGHRS